MNILGKLFGSPKATAQMVDTVKSGLDKMVFTDEEKSDVGERYREWFLKWLEVTNPQTLARRFIAVTITLIFALLVLVSTALAIVGALTGQPNFTDAYTIVFSILTDAVAMPFSGIMAFYFMAHLSRTFSKPRE